MSQHWYNPATGVLTDPYTKGAYVSVTTILDIPQKPGLDDWVARVGAEVADAKNLAARTRGTNVHAACEDYNLGATPDYLNEEELAYFQGYLNWFSAQDNHEILHSELFLRSPKYKFAGTADIICLIDEVLWLIDIKTSAAHQHAHGLQLKAYQQAYYEMFGVRPRMAVLKLTDKTKKGWQWKEYNEPFKPFLALLSYHKWTVRKRKAVELKDGWQPNIELNIEKVLVLT